MDIHFADRVWYNDQVFEVTDIFSHNGVAWLVIEGAAEVVEVPASEILETVEEPDDA